MILIKVITTCGNYWMTRFNGTEEEARKYYIGNTFNIGVVKDKLVQVESVELL